MSFTDEGHDMLAIYFQCLETAVVISGVNATRYQPSVPPIDTTRHLKVTWTVHSLISGSGHVLYNPTITHQCVIVYIHLHTLGYIFQRGLKNSCKPLNVVDPSTALQTWNYVAFSRNPVKTAPEGKKTYLKLWRPKFAVKKSATPYICICSIIKWRSTCAACRHAWSSVTIICRYCYLVTYIQIYNM